MVQPVVGSGPFAYDKINVEDQEQNPTSLLARIRALIRARRKVSTLLRGRTFAVAGNNSALYVRGVGDGVEFVLTVHNLSGRKQSIHLNFGGHFAAEISDLLAEEALSVRATLSLTVPAYGYRWFRGTKSNH